MPLLFGQGQFSFFWDRFEVYTKTMPCSGNKLNTVSAPCSSPISFPYSAPITLHSPIWPEPIMPWATLQTKRLRESLLLVRATNLSTLNTSNCPPPHTLQFCLELTHTDTDLQTQLQFSPFPFQMVKNPSNYQVDCQWDSKSFFVT